MRSDRRTSRCYNRTASMLAMCLFVPMMPKSNKEGFTTWRDVRLKNVERSADFQLFRLLVLPLVVSKAVAIWRKQCARINCKTTYTGLLNATAGRLCKMPKDNETDEALLFSAQNDGGTTLHVVAINREQTRGAVRKAFEAWLDRQHGFSGVRGKGKTSSTPR